ncbi:cyanophycinase [Spirosoma sp. KUDC1026]|uniref:cyanophycinase n=1 Tax=Spirosoma sp. KUDC1026 TaxID=2745947 RepID=UPI00159BB91D|nr:cyanophycinase [Spirosoma sp. KUDC1026]QKZ14027.1 cyanophycinase [Spirosoma sp. KUDC1026]
MRRRLLFLTLSALFLTLATTLAQTSGSQSKYIGPEKGALIIVGGGAVTPDIWNRFIELAGGKEAAHVVVIPTAGDDSSAVRPPREFETLKKLGVTKLTVLHTRDPKEANTEAFVAPLKNATAVWFVGGRHWRLADSYLNTLAHKEFNALLSRGGVIGGTSAGATIQGSFMVRGDTKGNAILIGDHTQGFDFIHNVTIDQHVMRRNRQFDLIGVIRDRPELLGLGIDESTAVVVQQNTFEVLGNSYVGIYDAKQIASNAQYPSGQNSAGGPFYYLGKGQKFDLQTRTVISRTAQAGGEVTR